MGVGEDFGGWSGGWEGVWGLRVGGFGFWEERGEVSGDGIVVGE